jgi:hypothetical protein
MRGLTGLPLIELNLAENDLSRIEHVQDIVTLQRLNLSGNRISRIPSSMARLRNLGMLRLSRNQLSVIEDIANLVELRGLSNITLDDNPMTAERDVAAVTRSFAVHTLPSLAAVSSKAISPSERQDVYRHFTTGTGFQGLADAQELVAERTVSALRRSRTGAGAGAHTDAGAPNSPRKAQGREVVLPPSPAHSYLGSPSIAAREAADGAASAADVLEITGRLDKLASRLLDSDREKGDVSRDLAEARRELQKSTAPSRGRGQEERGDYGFSPPRPPHLSSSAAVGAEVEAMESAAQFIRGAGRREEAAAAAAAAAAAEALQHDLDRSREEEKSVRLLSTRYAEELEAALAALEREKRANGQLRRENDGLLSSRDGTGGVGVRVRELEQQLRASEGDREDAITSAQRAESELERCQDRLATTTSRLAQRDDDLREVRERCRAAEGERDALESSVKEVERAAAKATVAAEDAHKARSAEEEVRFKAEREVAALTARLGAMQRDMDAYLSAANRSDLLKVMATKGVIGTVHAPPSAETLSRQGKGADGGVAFTVGTGGVGSMFARMDGAAAAAAAGTGQAAADNKKGPAKKARRRRAAYLDAPSTDTSVEGYDAFRRGIEEEEEEEDEEDAVEGGGGAEVVTDPTLQPYIIATGMPGDRPKTLEAAAVEAVAFILYSELNNADLSALRQERDGRRRQSQATGGRPSSVDLSSSSVGQACVTTAMRLIRTAIKKTRGGSHDDTDDGPTGVVKPVTADDIILPLSALGDRMVLADMVMEAQAGLVALSMAESSREEQLHLNRVIGELEATEKTLVVNIDKKKCALGDVNADVDAARDRAREVIGQLEELVTSLTERREELATTESGLQISRKEVEVARRDLEETQSLTDLEHKSLLTTKEKLRVLREEASHCEANIARTRHSVSEQEARIRGCKQAASEELRAIQSEHARVGSELAGRQAECEELDRYKTFLEAETEERRKTLEAQTSQLDREVEEATRAVAALRSESRAGRLECDQILGKRRTLQIEFDRLTDALSALQVRSESEQEGKKRGLESLTKRLEDGEKHEAGMRSRVQALTSEITALKRNVEDLTRQEHDLGRAIEARRRTAEAELQHANQQTEGAQRAARLAASQAEDKRQALEALAADVRLADRRAEEHKRIMRELEDVIQHARQEAKTAELERDRMRKEGTQVRPSLTLTLDSTLILLLLLLLTLVLTPTLTYPPPPSLVTASATR